MILALFAALSLGLTSPSQDTVRPLADIEFFVQAGCPRCGKAKAFLAEWQREQPALTVVERDVSKDRSALRRLAQLAEARGIDALGVPAFYLRGVLLIGFDEAETTGETLRRILSTPAGPRTDLATGAGDAATPLDIIDAALVGPLRVSQLGLPLFTIAIGLVDGLNPCAMWALLFILSLLVNLRSRARMLLVGGTFVLVAGVMYYAFMAAWLEFFLLVGFSRSIRLALGGLALFVGAINLKDVVAFGRGPTLAIPQSARPGLYARARRILTAQTWSARSWRWRCCRSW